MVETFQGVKSICPCIKVSVTQFKCFYISNEEYTSRSLELNKIKVVLLFVLLIILLRTKSLRSPYHSTVSFAMTVSSAFHFIKLTPLEN